MESKGKGNTVNVILCPYSAAVLKRASTFFLVVSDSNSGLKQHHSLSSFRQYDSAILLFLVYVLNIGKADI